MTNLTCQHKGLKLNILLHQNILQKNRAKFFKNPCPIFSATHFLASLYIFTDRKNLIFLRSELLQYYLPLYNCRGYYKKQCAYFFLLRINPNKPLPTPNKIMLAGSGTGEAAGTSGIGFALLKMT